MIKHLKPILLNIARLKLSDQQWILQQLPEELAHKFQQKKGLQLLDKARRLLRLSSSTDATIPAIASLPNYCLLLQQKAPLYIAIILEQGHYPWEDDFLSEYHQPNRITMAQDAQLAGLKPAIKAAVWQEWQQSLSFDQYLENHHG